MAYNGVMAVILCYFSKLGIALDAHCVKWLKIYLNFLQKKCSPKFLVLAVYTMYGTPPSGGNGI